MQAVQAGLLQRREDVQPGLHPGRALPPAVEQLPSLAKLQQSTVRQTPGQNLFMYRIFKHAALLKWTRIFKYIPLEKITMVDSICHVYEEIKKQYQFPFFAIRN